jgi:glucosamine-6-phosphate deaminase
MARPLSKINHDWWDYTTLDPQILEDAARLTAKDIEQLARPGFEVRMYDTMESFWMAEAME